MVLKRPDFPRPSASTVDKARSALDRALGGSKVIASEDALFSYAGDESEQEPVLPDAVVLASSVADVAKTVEVAAEVGVPLTPRGGGSGKSGGAVPVCGGIVLCTLGMKDIKEIDTREQLAVVQPGIILGDLYEAVEAEGMFYPPDPNSWDVCALGGNIAENAGGPRAFKYGVTREYVLGLEAITAQGTRLRTGRRTVKGVTGYDMTALLIGSEGTLGITVEATLRLIRKPDAVVTLLSLFDSVGQGAQSVAAMVAAGLVPRCLELIDGACLDAMRNDGVAVDGRAGAMLIIEVDGDVQACERDMERVGEHAMEAGAIDVLVAQDAAQRDRLWAARRQLSDTTRKLARHKIAEDLVVPRGKMAELVQRVDQISERLGVRMLSYGHAGDGNLHVNVLWDEPDEEPKVEQALDEVVSATISMGGTLTGEHGIGLSKAPYLPLEQSAELIDLQRDIKRLFDPKGILNPGKIFGQGGHGPC